MLKTLVLIRLKYLFNSLFRPKAVSEGKKRNPALVILFGLLAVYLVCVFFFMFGSMFLAICEPLCLSGYAWLYFAIVAIFSFFMCILGNLFFVKTEIYESKDNNLLFSMPIPPSKILASRLIAIIITSYFYEFMIVIPAAVIFGIVWRYTLVGFIDMVIGFIVLPFLSLAVSLLIGAFLAYLDTVFSKKNVVSIIFSIGFIFAYFYVIQGVQKYIAAIIENAAVVAATVKRYTFFLFCFGNSITGRNPVDLFIFCLVAIVPFILICMILSVSYIKIVTTSKSGKKKKYKGGELSVLSPKAALRKKEIRRFSSSALYMMNAGIGLLFIVAGAIALPFFVEQLYTVAEQLPGLENHFGALAILTVCGILSMVTISASTISLEGKNIWITKTLPLPPKDILLAKAYPHIIVSTPPILLFSLSACIFLDISFVMRLLVIIVPFVFNIVMAIFGVVINLIFPKLEWANEIIPIKQGISVLFTMLFGMVASTVPLLLLVFVLGKFVISELCVIIYLALLCLALRLLYRYLKSGGVKRYNAL